MFYRIISSAYPILIELLGLRQYSIVVNCSKKTQRQGVASEALQLDNIEQFAALLESATKVYVVLVGVVSLELKNSTTIVLVELPSQLKNYANVASISEARKLLKHQESNYRINIKLGELVPFGPLYNLSPKELEVL